MVVAREDAPGDTRLVAYVVMAKPDTLNANELRESLRKILPEHMMPAAFVSLAELPLTTSGKIDRRALPVPNYESAQAGLEYEEPRTQTEKAMATIWAETLQLNRIGIHDNFFQLGGHSLLAVRLFAQISRTFGKTVSMNTLFFFDSTIAELSALIDSKADAVPKNRLIAIQSQGSKAPLFWFPGGVGSVLAFREASLLLGPDQPVYGLESKLPGPGEAFEEVEIRARYFVQLIQSLQPEGPYHLAGFCSGGAGGVRNRTLAGRAGRYPGVGGVGRVSPFSLSGRISGHHRLLEAAALLVASGAVRRSVGGAGWRRLSSAPRRATFPPTMNSSRWRCKRKRLWPKCIASSTPCTGSTAAIIRCSLNSRVCMLVGEDDYFGMGVSRAADPRLAWLLLLSGGFDIVTAPGDHLYMLRAPRVKIFAKRLEAALAESTMRAAESARAGSGKASSQPPDSTVKSGAAGRHKKISTRLPR